MRAILAAILAVACLGLTACSDKTESRKGECTGTFDDIDCDGIPNDQDDDLDGDGLPNDDDDDTDGDGIPNDQDEEPGTEPEGPTGPDPDRACEAGTPCGDGEGKCPECRTECSDGTKSFSASMCGGRKCKSCQQIAESVCGDAEVVLSEHVGCERL
jgi:hypothetical protein